MDERSKFDLPHGHFGRATYNSAQRAWTFGRALTVGESLKPRDVAANDPRIHNASSRNAKPHDAHREPPNKRYSKQIRSLVRLYPEIHAATDLLAPLLKVSEAVELAAKSHDPSRGSLISFTHIRSATSHKHVSVAAYASGGTGCELRLARVLDEKRSLDGDTSSWLEVPTISGEQTSASLGGPIQQVRFGPSSTSGNTFLAVRLFDKIVFFQPIVGAAISTTDDRSSLRLDHLHSISTQGLDQRFADVCFNPWFPQQVGVVDCTGKWQVSESSSRKLERIIRTWSRPHSDGDTDDGSMADGWARLAWVADPEILVVCTRTTLRLCSIAGQHAVTVQQIDIQADGSSTPVWIIDFMVLPEHDHFCLVTSQHIVIYHVKNSTPLGASCHVKARIRHFRNADDLSLRLTCWTESGTLRLLLFSSAYSWASVYRCRLPALDQLLAEDPIILAEHQDRDQRNAAFNRDLHIKPLQAVRKQTQQTGDGVHSATLKGSSNFYLVNAMQDDHSVSEGIWQSFPLVRTDTAGHAMTLSSTVEEKRSSSRLLKGDFIVDDDVMETGSQSFHQNEPFARRTRRQVLQQDFDDCTISIELIANDLSTSDALSLDLGDVTSNVRRALSGAVSAATLPLQTLTNFAKFEITAEDIGDASQLLEDLVDSGPTKADKEVVDEDFNLRNAIFDVDLPDITGLGNELHGRSLRTVYDSFISRWISSLQPQVPGWIRLAKVEIVRRATAELVLASRMIRVQDDKTELLKKEAEDEGNPSRQIWELPMRSSGVGSSQKISSSSPVFEDDRKLPLLPTPSPTATPSVTTASSHPSSFAAPELLRLSRYTTFTKPSPSVLPRSLSKVLSHWKPGEDLEGYDWLSTSRHLSQKEDDDVDEEMTEKDRKRVQRRAERHIRRQRKEAAASQAQQLASSQAAEIFSASQPAFVKMEHQPTGVAGSSQSQGPGAFTTSQVVPGRFGGRPPSRKRRKQGF